MIRKFGEIEDKEAEKVRITYNYHTHNYLCGHAAGTVCDYVKEAIKNGLKSIGISDHFAHPALLPSPYMDEKKLQSEYLPQFAAAEAEYGGKIRIYRGLEIEYFAGYDALYERLLQSVDYLILGEHYFLHDGKIACAFFTDDKDGVMAYFDRLIDGLQTGYFSILAHPDVIFSHGFSPDAEVLEKFEDVIRCCKDCGVKAEINGNGARANGFNYPTDYLLKICKKLNAPVVVSADSHRPESLCDIYTKKLYCVARDMGLNIAEDGFIKKRK